MRLPRLERLASALGLCAFEKNVVVAMIGQAIAPRSIGLMAGGSSASSPSKTMQVEVCGADLGAGTHHPWDAHHPWTPIIP